MTTEQKIKEQMFNELAADTPKEYHDMIKGLFGILNNKTKEKPMNTTVQELKRALKSELKQLKKHWMQQAVELSKDFKSNTISESDFNDCILFAYDMAVHKFNINRTPNGDPARFFEREYQGKLGEVIASAVIGLEPDFTIYNNLPDYRGDMSDEYFHYHVKAAPKRVKNYWLIDKDLMKTRTSKDILVLVALEGRYDGRVVGLVDSTTLPTDMAKATVAPSKSVLWEHKIQEFI